MKRTLITPTVLFAASAASVDSVEDALLNAQSVYHTVLRAQNGNDGRIISLQTDLADTQWRTQKAQTDIDHPQEELASAMLFKNEQASTLQQAGQRLDAAWQAAYGPGGMKAARWFPPLNRSMMKTVPLRPEHADPLAQAFYTERHDFAPWPSVGKIRAYYETCPQGSGLSVAFAAIDGQSRLFGSSALKRYDIAALPQYEYWLGGVLVLPPYRGKGTGKLLAEHCLGAARRMRPPALYLYTPDV